MAILRNLLFNSWQNARWRLLCLNHVKPFCQVTAAQTFGLVNLVFSRQTVFFECEHPFIDNPMDIAESTVASTGLGSKPYPSNLQRMFSKYHTRLEQSLSRDKEHVAFLSFLWTYTFSCQIKQSQGDMRLEIYYYLE